LKQEQYVSENVKLENITYSKAECLIKRYLEKINNLIKLESNRINSYLIDVYGDAIDYFINEPNISFFEISKITCEETKKFFIVLCAKIELPFYFEIIIDSNEVRFSEREFLHEKKEFNLDFYQLSIFQKTFILGFDKYIEGERVPSFTTLSKVVRSCCLPNELIIYLLLKFCVDNKVVSGPVITFNSSLAKNKEILEIESIIKEIQDNHIENTSGLSKTLIERIEAIHLSFKSEDFYEMDILSLEDDDLEKMTTNKITSNISINDILFELYSKEVEIIEDLHKIKLKIFSAYLEMCSYEIEKNNIVKNMFTKDSVNYIQNADNIIGRLILLNSDYFTSLFKQKQKIDFMKLVLFPDFLYKLKLLKESALTLNNLHVMEDEKCYSLLLNFEKYQYAYYLNSIEKSMNLFKLLFPLYVIFLVDSYPDIYKEIAEKVYLMFQDIFFGMLIHKIVIQNHPVQNVPELRGSDDYSTRLLIYFSLQNGFVYILRLDFPHKGQVFFHINIQEANGDKLVDSYCPVQKEYIDCLGIDESILEGLFFETEDKYWFRLDFESRLKECESNLSKTQLKKLNELCKEQQHCFISDCDEQQILDFMRDYMQIFEFLNNNISINDDVETIDIKKNDKGDSDFLFKIRKSLQFYDKLQQLFSIPEFISQTEAAEKTIIDLAKDIFKDNKEFELDEISSLEELFVFLSDNLFI